MDEAFRNALRALKRQDGNFSALELHEFMDIDQIDDLINHSIIARLKLMGIEKLTVSNKPPGLVNQEESGLKPRILAVSHSSYEYRGSKSINSLNDLPQAFTFKLLMEGFGSIVRIPEALPKLFRIQTIPIGLIDRSNYPSSDSPKFLAREIWVYPSSNASKAKIISVIELWEESLAEFERSKTKRLRERGLLPGRNHK